MPEPLCPRCVEHCKTLGVPSDMIEVHCRSTKAGKCSIVNCTCPTGNGLNGMCILCDAGFRSTGAIR